MRQILRQKNCCATYANDRATESWCSTTKTFSHTIKQLLHQYHKENELATCHLSLVTCHLSLVTCHLPLATCHLPLVTRQPHLSLATCHFHLPLATCHFHLPLGLGIDLNNKACWKCRRSGLELET